MDYKTLQKFCDNVGWQLNTFGNENWMGMMKNEVAYLLTALDGHLPWAWWFSSWSGIGRLEYERRSAVIGSNLEFEWSLLKAPHGRDCAVRTSEAARPRYGGKKH